MALEIPDKNKYILVVGDYFSMWTEAFPLPNKEASSIVKVLTEEWVCQFGLFIQMKAETSILSFDIFTSVIHPHIMPSPIAL